MKATVACIFVLAVSLANSPAFAGGPFADDVVVVYCERQSALTGTVFVSHAASSPGAPSVTIGTDTNCAEELAKLTNVKFRIQSVVPGDSSYIVYTMVRK